MWPKPLRRAVKVVKKFSILLAASAILFLPLVSFTSFAFADSLDSNSLDPPPSGAGVVKAYPPPKAMPKIASVIDDRRGPQNGTSNSSFTFGEAVVPLTDIFIGKSLTKGLTHEEIVKIFIEKYSNEAKELNYDPDKILRRIGEKVEEGGFMKDGLIKNIKGIYGEKVAASEKGFNLAKKSNQQAIDGVKELVDGRKELIQVKTHKYSNNLWRDLVDAEENIDKVFSKGGQVEVKVNEVIKKIDIQAGKYKKKIYIPEDAFKELSKNLGGKNRELFESWVKEGKLESFKLNNIDAGRDIANGVDKIKNVVSKNADEAVDLTSKFKNTGLIEKFSAFISKKMPAVAGAAGAWMAKLKPIGKLLGKFAGPVSIIFGVWQLSGSLPKFMEVMKEEGGFFEALGTKDGKVSLFESISGVLDVIAGGALIGAGATAVTGVGAPVAAALATVAVVAGALSLGFQAAAWATENWEVIEETFKNVVEWTKEKGKQALDFIKNAPGMAYNFVSNLGKDLISKTKNFATKVIDKAKDIASTAYNKAKEVWGDVKEIAKDAGQAIGSMVGGAITVIKDAGVKVGNFAKGVIDGAKDLGSKIGNAITNSPGAAKEFAKDMIKAAGKAVSTGKKIVGDSAAKAANFASKMADTVKSTTVATYSAIKDGAFGTASAISNAAQAAYTTATTTTVKAYNAVKTTVSNAVSTTKAAVSNAASNAKSAISNAATTAKTAVSNAVSAAKTNISNAANSAKTTMSNVSNSISSGFNKISSGISSFFGGSKPAAAAASAGGGSSGSSNLSSPRSSAPAPAARSAPAPAPARASAPAPSRSSASAPSRSSSSGGGSRGGGSRGGGRR